MSENWKPIPGLENYDVSDMGNVRSWRQGYGRYGRTKTPKMLRPITDQYGYKRITLQCGEGSQSFYVHRLMLTAFVGPCPDAMECCHNNDDKQDNRLSNLRWDLTTKNRREQTAHRLCAHGEHHGHATMTEEQIITIRERYAAGERAADIASDFGKARQSIHGICRGAAWKYAPGPTHHHPNTRGENNGLAKLTEQQVVEIRERYAALEPLRPLGQEFGISTQTIKAIGTGKTWRHVGGPITLHRTRSRSHS